MPIKCPQRPNRASQRARQADEQWQRDRARERAERARQEQERIRREWERAQERARQQRQQNYYTSTPPMTDANKALALELVNAGYRALSRKHHPDAGGSHEQMVAVNKICDILRIMINGRR